MHRRRTKDHLKHLDLLNEFRTALSQLATEVEAASAMQMYDINTVCENLMLGVFGEIYGWRDLRNLNAAEKSNFPGIDLADDKAGVAIQVTATSNLDKVKDTIKTFLGHGLDKKYQRLIIYVLGRRQGSYSQDAIDRVAGDRVKFSATDDILDYRDLCGAAADVGPKQLAAALEVVREYMRGGVARGLSEEDFDPPASPPQRVNLNLIEISLPLTLYIADLRAPIEPSKGRRGRGGRRMVREALQAFDLRPPSDFEVSSRQLITFHPLDDAHGPFANVIELGTVTPLHPREFYGLDDDRERIFKSLLRLTLQQKLYRHKVQWMHEDDLFIFIPRDEGDNLREESWFGQRASTRRVYERKLNRKDPSKTFLCKHLAFSTDFILSAGRWYVAITPDWHFSFGADFRRSAYADANLAWLKRQEVNRTVADHFRFLNSWLSSLDQDDFFDSAKGPATSLAFADVVSFPNHPRLPDDSWLPSKERSDDDAGSNGLFESL